MIRARRPRMCSITLAALERSAVPWTERQLYAVAAGVEACYRKHAPWQGRVSIGLCPRFVGPARAGSGRLQLRCRQEVRRVVVASQ